MTCPGHSLRVIALGGLICAASLPRQAWALEILIREVRPGTPVVAPFVELQLLSNGQGALTGHTLTIYNADGTLARSFTFPSGVANGDSQRTVLISPGTPDGVTPDFDPGLGIIGPGAVCFDTECVAWGGAQFTGAANLPGPVGTPHPTGLIGTTSITRRLTGGCPTSLDPADDTNDSASDFEEIAATPRNNATTPTEQSCFLFADGFETPG